MRVLLIEDDPMIGKSLRQALQNESMVVDWTRSGVEGEDALVSNDYGVVLLDLNLPDKNGIDVLRSTRQSGNKAPLLVITARDEVDDRIAGLDLATHEMTYGGQSRILSAREFALMRALMERPGTILSRAQLEERLYGWGEEVESNALDVLIHSLRKRFDKEIIRNLRGAGWMVLRG